MLSPVRTLESLISIGRFMPAMTSTRPDSITEMARLDGVPPNMSVRTMTPEPVSARATASTISLAALLHVVVGADRHGFEVFLRPDDMLDGVAGIPRPADRASRARVRSFCWLPSWPFNGAHSCAPAGLPSAAAGALSCRRESR